MKEMDVILLSYAKSDKLKQITQNAIQTLIDSSKEIRFNIIVVESEKKLKPYEYEYTKTYYFDEPFNYNHYMNLASQFEDSEYIAFCNNDLIFIEEWADNIIKYMEEYNLDSASPLCPMHHGNKIINEPVILGKNTGKELIGWCIVIKRDYFNKLGGLDDYVTFYCSDNSYEIQLRKTNARHGLVTRSNVVHLTSKTLETIKNPNKYTTKQVQLFNKINYMNILGMGDGS